MAFNSYSYLLLLIPIVTLYWLLPAKSRPLYLLITSLVYAATWQPQYIWLPLLIAAAAWLTLRRMEAAGRENAGVWMKAGIAVLLVPLCFFKYSGFVLENVSALWAGAGWGPIPVTLAIGLPLGISFYTFDAISVLLDARQGRIKKPGGMDLALMASFWPYLLSGPIVRYREIVPQLRASRPFDLQQLISGVDRLLLGLVQKNVLANSMGAIAAEGFLPKSALTNSSLDNWMLAAAYGLQVYFDFAGYTNMAIGTGRLLGLNLPENFRFPYHAANPADFWSRWHMSLSRWIRDYLFFSLNAKYKGAPLPLYASLIGIMTLVGLWHGAGWGFILWGTMHGLYLVLYRIWESATQGRPALAQSSAVRAGWRMVTVVAVVAAWVPFRATTLGQALQMLHSMFLSFQFSLSYNANNFLLVVLTATLAALEPWLASLIERGDISLGARARMVPLNFVVRPLVYAALLLFYLIFDDRNAQFIYFQF